MMRLVTGSRTKNVWQQVEANSFNSFVVARLPGQHANYEHYKTLSNF